VWRPVDLPKGLPHDDPRQNFPTSAAGCVRGCPRDAAVGRCQVGGTPHEPQLGQGQGAGPEAPERHHRTRHLSARATRAGTATSKDKPPDYRPSSGVRIDTEEVMP
jgi:hypothetical protein